MSACHRLTTSITCLETEISSEISLDISVLAYIIFSQIKLSYAELFWLSRIVIDEIWLQSNGFTPFVGWQEWHLVCNKLNVGMLVMVDVLSVLTSVICRCSKIQNDSLIAAYVGFCEIWPLNKCCGDSLIASGIYLPR